MKRSIALLLCIATFLSAFGFYTPGALAAEKGVFISNDGERISEIIIRQDEKQILRADAAGIDADSYQWQLLLDAQSDLWVSVYDKTERDCEISYALLQNLLDKANSSYIRCAVSAGGETFYSEAVCVSVAPVHEPDGNPATYAAPETTVAPRKASKAPRAASADSEYVTITIKYLDESSLTGVESAVYSPYTATIERGTPFQQDVLSPTFLGFAPYYDKTGGTNIGDSASTVSIDIGSVTENVEIKVYYKPIDVDFAIRYFFQNINDDLYTEDVARYYSGREKTGTIIEDDFLRLHAGNTTGFEKMYHVPENIAADGSTVFECYYDRKYYLIQFDLDGGYGTDPVYARYGTPFLVNEPTRYGYKFSGWELLTIDTDKDGVPDKGDGKVEENFPSVIGAGNMYFRAVWESVNTTYSRAYWAEKSDGTLEYLGAIRTSAKSGDIVSGSDDLKEKYDLIFPFEYHEHNDKDGCWGNCPRTPGQHVHMLPCYTKEELRYASIVGQTDQNVSSAFTGMRQHVTEPLEGHIYRFGSSNVIYNFFYFDRVWYYLGTNDTYGGFSVGAWWGGGIDKPAEGGVTSGEPNTICGEKNGHIHQDDCVSCTKLVHIHNENCNPNPRYYVYSHSDQNEVIEGDGSTTVNIYYKPREYTLRFYYARESAANGYQVCGGSTYAFGGYGVSNPGSLSVQDLLLKVPESYWGKAVKPESPFYDNKALSGSTSDTSKYNTGEEKVGSYIYHYFEFTADYGDDISNKWPVGILAPVKMVDKHNHSYTYTDSNGVEHSATISKDNDYQNAYFSAWNGEYKVQYTQTHLKANGGDENLTIKGRYMTLDEKLIHAAAFDNNFENSSLISYLGFWDNGANIPWSVPKLFQYHLMLEVPSTTVIDEKNGTVTENGVVLDKDKVRIITQDHVLVLDIPEGTRIFRLHGGMWYEQYQTFRTFDDSVVKTQTFTHISGFNFQERKWSRRENGYYSEIGQETIRDAYDVFFYYARQNYSLTYFNYENVISAEFVDYNTPLTADKYDRENHKYPPSLEPGAYEFVGWYTSPMRIYPIDFNTARMPAENTVWYAKWVPVQHKVNFFTSYDEMLSYESDSTSVTPYDTFSEVEHGTLIGKNVESPKKTGDGGKNLIFVGWFYMENGEKKAFTPLDMRVNKDMNIFADWSSSSPQPYLIKYEVFGSPGVKVADDTTGFAYAGSTRTFTAKAGYP